MVSVVKLCNASSFSAVTVLLSFCILSEVITLLYEVPSYCLEQLVKMWDCSFLYIINASGSFLYNDELKG